MIDNKIANLKKIFLIIAIFIPTIAAVLIYIIGSVINNNTAKKAIMIEIFNAQQVALKINVDDVKPLIAVFENAEKTKKEDKNFSEELNEMPYITIKLTSLKTEFIHKYYYSEKTQTVYTTDDNKKVYILDRDFSESFMSTKYAISLYKNSSPPQLVSSTDDTIPPVNIKWMYLDANNQYIKNNLITTVSLDSFSLNTSGAFSLNFSMLPDICMIKVFSGETIIFNGTSSDFVTADINFQNPYKYEVKAEWLKTDSCKFYGEINYTFTTVINAPPVFWLEKQTIESGEFVVLSGKYVNNIEKIKFSCSPSIDFTPTFFTDGQYVRALIPANMELDAPTQYSITVTYSNIPTTLNLSVSARAEKALRLYDASSISVTRSNAVLDEYKNLLTTLTQNTSSVKYFSGTFFNHETIVNQNNNPTMTLLLGYGRTRSIDGGATSYMLDGVDYWTSESGVSVLALNTGVVTYVGNCDLLGNFVVIDHGFGLKTWYAHLSSVNVNINDAVIKSTVIGKTGKTGFTNSNGFYLITTIYNVPISPYGLESEGVLMTNK